MRTVLARKNYLMLHDDGRINYPLSKFLSDRFTNPHTRELVGQSLRVFYRFCCANKLELSYLAHEGKCLSYEQIRQLAGLCFRPLPEVETLSDKKVRSLTSAKAGKAPEHQRDAVEPNTADKRLSHIATFLIFFLEVFLEPGIRSNSMRQQLRQEYEKVAKQLRNSIGGTKQGHHHEIKSLPSDKFLKIIEEVYLRPAELFRNPNQKLPRNLLRDRAMILLACEGLRPGTIGNVGRADFKPESKQLIITDHRDDRDKTTTNTPVLKLGASTMVNSASETMIELWPITIDAIQNYISVERTAVLSKRLQNRSKGFLFLNERGEPIKHRATITKVFATLGKRLAEIGLLDIGCDPYFHDQKRYDFYAYVLRHSSGSLFLELKGTEDRALDSMKVRYGWTMNSKQPERYAARALSDQSNIVLNDFNNQLIAAARIQADSK
jgi:integrase